MALRIPSSTFDKKNYVNKKISPSAGRGVKNSTAASNQRYAKFLTAAFIVGISLFTLNSFVFKLTSVPEDMPPTTFPIKTIPPIQRSTKCIQRTPAQQAIVDARDRPLILYLSTFWGNQWGTLEEVMYKRFNKDGVHSTEVPHCYDCDSTTDQSRFAEASIVVYHLPDTGATIRTKYCGQYNAMVSLEAPPYYETFNAAQSLTQERARDVLSQMDISMTYRLDSDIPMPHFTFWYEEHFGSAMLKPLRVPPHERNSKTPVAWIASKCETDNDRIAYVKELSKYIGVASYGKCFHNAEFSGVAKSYDEEASRTTATHKFYLSFENSNCDYYVTEKLTRTLELGVIPIIMGSPDTNDYLPNNHTGINVADFKSPRHLAELLNKINDDDALFESYFAYKNDDISPEFKDRWFTQHRHRACKLCDIAKNKVPVEELNGMQFDFSCKKQVFNFSKKLRINYF